MDEKTQQLIEALATKLGTTAEHLWGVLVRQAPISGVVDAALCVALVSAFVWLLRLAITKTSRPKETESCPYPHAQWEDEVAFAVWVATFLYGGFTMVCVISSLEGIAAAFLNPDYWAFHRLLTALK